MASSGYGEGGGGTGTEESSYVTPAPCHLTPFTTCSPGCLPSATEASPCGTYTPAICLLHLYGPLPPATPALLSQYLSLLLGHLATSLPPASPLLPAPCPPPLLLLTFPLQFQLQQGPHSGLGQSTEHVRRSSTPAVAVAAALPLELGSELQLLWGWAGAGSRTCSLPWLE